jgi:chitodextrinase
VGADTKAQIIVSWDTDEPAIGQVVWGQGTGTEYPQATEKDGALTTKHVFVIRDLQPTTSYHLKIVATDKSGNKAESKDTVVVTPTAQQAAFDVILKNLEDVFGFLRL